jgi:UDP:flavonoid glycosyltransferase YjiC (YdhE family)
MKSLRILVSVRPYRGHFHSLVPLIHALLGAGHRVLVATGTGIGAVVRDAGLDFSPAGLNVFEARERNPSEDPSYGVCVLSTKVEDLLRILRGPFRADLMIRESTDLAAALAAEVQSIPCVTFGVYANARGTSWNRIAGNSIATLRGMLELRADAQLLSLRGNLFVDVVPPSFDSVVPWSMPATIHARYEPWEGSRLEPPPWLLTMPDRPTVLVTLGTVYHVMRKLMRTLLSSLADEDVNVICTTGETLDVVTNSDVPANVRQAGYLPHSLILGSCVGIVCHGGFNTMMGALCSGVPMVCVPQGSDQHYNARRSAELGFGIHLGGRSGNVLSPESLRYAVRRLVNEPAFRLQAQAMQKEIGQQVDIASVVGPIESLV